MHTSRLLLAGFAALLFGCQMPARQAPADDQPQNNPTQTSTDLATGSG